jgi:hypothetical protein
MEVKFKKRNQCGSNLYDSSKLANKDFGQRKAIK